MNSKDENNLPSGWTWANVSDISQINPKLLYDEVDNNKLVSFIPMRFVEAESGKILVGEEKKYMAVKKGYTSFIDGDILFAKITPCMENGKIAIVENLKNGIGFGSTEFHVFRIFNHIDNKYFYYYLLQKKFRNFAQRNMTGSAGQLRVPVNFFSHIKVPLPPSFEQNRIVAKIEELFSQLDAGIAELKKAKAQLKIYRQSVLKYAFEGKLTEEWRKENADIFLPIRHTFDEIKILNSEKIGQDKPTKLPPIDYSNLDVLPKNWSWIEAHKVCSSVRDGTHDTPKYVNEGYPLITSKNLKPNGIDFDNVNNISEIDHVEITKRSGVEEGDILFGMIGTIGNPVLVKSKIKFSIKNVGLFKKNSKYLNSRYLKYWLGSLSCQRLLENKELIKGTTQKFIPLGNLRILPVPFCCLEEQNQIVQEIESRLSIADHLEQGIEQSLQKAEALRQSILKQAFEGKLVPQDPNDEPAEKLLERIKAEKENSEKGSVKSDQ